MPRWPWLGAIGQQHEGQARRGGVAYGDDGRRDGAVRGLGVRDGGLRGVDCQGAELGREAEAHEEEVGAVWQARRDGCAGIERTGQQIANALQRGDLQWPQTLAATDAPLDRESRRGEQVRDEVGAGADLIAGRVEQRAHQQLAADAPH